MIKLGECTYVDAARLARDPRSVILCGLRPRPCGQCRDVEPARLSTPQEPRPESEWHSGELETALMLSVRPGLVRRSLARKLPPAWVDFRERLKKGARRFREIDRKTRGYFGWPAVARAETATQIMKLRGKLIAAEVIRALGPRRRRPGKRSAR